MKILPAKFGDMGWCCPVCLLPPGLPADLLVEPGVAFVVKCDCGVGYYVGVKNPRVNEAGGITGDVDVPPDQPWIGFADGDGRFIPQQPGDV